MASKRKNRNSVNKRRGNKQPATAPPPSTTSSLTSSIFGSPAANEAESLSASIFGSSVSSLKINCNADLFGNPKKFQKLAEKRVKQNTQKAAVTNVSCDTPKLLSRQEIIDAREARTKFQKTIAITNSVTIDVPEVDTTGGLDLKEKEEVLRGRIKMFTIQCDTLMRENGVVVIKSNDRMIDKVFMQTLTAKSSAIEEEICTKLKERGHSFLTAADDGTNFRYAEVASRCLGRLDIKYKMDTQPFCNDQVISNSFIKPVVQSLLGDDAKLVYAGLILSFPGSADQPWHRDGTALFADNEFPIGQALPPYALNIFIPLDDVTSDVGPTEFCVGSHIREKAIEVMKEIETGNEAGTTIIGPLLKMGDALIYDYRVCHRGTKNVAKKKTRPMLYLMYSRPWFYEHINFGDETLFD